MAVGWGWGQTVEWSYMREKKQISTGCSSRFTNRVLTVDLVGGHWKPRRLIRLNCSRVELIKEVLYPHILIPILLAWAVGDTTTVT